MALSQNRELTKKRKLQIMAEVTAGKTLTEAGINAGYSPKTARVQASQALTSPYAKEAFARILARSGVTEDFLGKKIRSLLDAKTRHFFASDGIVTDERESEAHETQRKTTEMALRLFGHLKSDNTASTIINNAGLMQVVISQLSQQKE